MQTIEFTPPDFYRAVMKLCREGIIAPDNDGELVTPLSTAFSMMLDARRDKGERGIIGWRLGNILLTKGHHHLWAVIENIFGNTFPSDMGKCLDRELSKKIAERIIEALKRLDLEMEAGNENPSLN